MAKQKIPKWLTKKPKNPKDWLYQQVGIEVTKVLGKCPKALARALYELVIQGTFFVAVKEGYLRLPKGYGALRLRQYAETIRRIPATGERILIPSRRKIVYILGEAVKQLAKLKAESE